MLDEANKFHPNIKLVRQIGRNAPFLDVFIQNSNEALITSVYHKEAAESYIAPFGSDHPDHVFRNTVDTAITRGVRYSTTLSQFEEEIRQMKLMFLYNGYPSRHIDRRLAKLFSKYLSKHFILSMLYNSGDFDYLRHQLLRTSTHAEYDKATDNLIIYNQTRDKNMQNQAMKPVDTNELTTIKRLRNNHRHIHELWSRTFHQTEIMNTVLIIGTHLNHNLKQELMAKMINHIPGARSDQQSKT
ncbi:unnamed protein product [Rotaria magnacalcarata]|uniref:Helix-turn-helix domain-containing protein n=1 Tax=Rotaria magnacalcarata TaxID=392030 RepID=A0A815YGV7_9BILA|nr:unnamed protein product [Rotaria magnacalcarata]CAF1570627.1 unnamed protein product [Rotaria magnacalcarata]CAF3947377.1 unnamed protein product [Rotaria magnacalcarata]CAF4005659.1 unnamed protein product [Rotaria magnacalcarata]